MRDNGYKNTAYAVCELIDNSIQAGANNIDLMCLERVEQIGARSMRRLNMIAVSDNGIGMNKEELWTSLQFGNGTRLRRQDRTGIGRFGMGLPASSISQARKVEVWSWQNGISNALYTYLDIDEVKKTDNSEVPEPIRKNIPKCWLNHVTPSDCGTLVVWSSLDRLMWTKAKTLMDNSEELIGRIYRKFLNRGEIIIHMISFNEQDPKTIELSKNALPNDPMYLMDKTSCPEPFNENAMFEPFGDDSETTFEVEYQGERHEVIVRLSIAKKEARMTDNAGSTSYGKHASRNVGISIIRADRELELDQSIVNSYDPRERWWGVEVDFPPALDELFGVTNNKQTARNFSEVMLCDLETIANEEGKSFTAAYTDLKEENDPRALLFDISKYIKKNVSIMRDLIKSQRIGSRSSARARYFMDETAAKAATLATEQRKEDGYKGLSDYDEWKPKEERRTEIQQTLEEFEIDEDVVQELTAHTLDNNLKYLFAVAPVESDAFFVVRPKAGVINMVINERHPAYDNLVEVLEKDIDTDDAEKLKERLFKAATGLKLLLTAWARYEDELPDGKLKEAAGQTRSDWGRVAKGFLRN
ncbi:MAG TPA: ATP-binding protein [Clostridiales bacterium]|nr:ATP-binding protein [Clostridiales bacterium]